MSEPAALSERIVAYVKDPIEKAKRLIVTPVGQARMIVCTASTEEGASSVIETANSLLSAGNQITLIEVARNLNSAEQVVSFINDGNIELGSGHHVAFNLCDEQLAKQVERELALKVFS